MKIFKFITDATKEVGRASGELVKSVKGIDVKAVGSAWKGVAVELRSNLKEGYNSAHTANEAAKEQKKDEKSRMQEMELVYNKLSKDDIAAIVNDGDSDAFYTVKRDE